MTKIWHFPTTGMWYIIEKDFFVHPNKINSKLIIYKSLPHFTRFYGYIQLVFSISFIINFNFSFTIQRFYCSFWRRCNWGSYNVIWVPLRVQFRMSAWLKVILIEYMQNQNNNLQNERLSPRCALALRSALSFCDWN